MNHKINPKNGDKLSILGSGCMRLGGDSLTSPSTGGLNTKKAEQLIKSAIDSGVNYFDTTYIYNGNEEVFGKALAKCGVRDKVYTITKMPPILCRSRNDLDKYFIKHLERLQTDYIDYYLFHILADMRTWDTLCEWGIKKWVAEKKALDQTKQFGPSSHGAQDEFMALLDAYDWDSCQTQYNYSDENYQTGVKGLKKVVAKSTPMMIVEPLLDGKLAGSLPEAAVELLKVMRFGTKFFVRKK